MTHPLIIEPREDGNLLLFVMPGAADRWLPRFTISARNAEVRGVCTRIEEKQDEVYDSKVLIFCIIC